MAKQIPKPAARKPKLLSRIRGRKEPCELEEQPLAEGMARCVCNDAMERDLKVGEVVYIREIPNMRGHRVILRNKKSPLVGDHLDRFQLLDADE